MLIHVNSSDLKSVFKDIKPIFKGSTDAAIMGFNIENHILYITCSSGIVYEQQIASEHPGPYSLTVLYQDLSEILPGRGVVELDLSPLFVSVKCDSMSSTLQQANGIVSRYNRRGGTFSKLSTNDVKQWARLFSETAPVTKSLQREAPVIFKPPYAIMKFPSFWLQLPNTVLDTVMALSELKAVAEFGPTEYSVTADAIEFKRGSAILAVPRNAADSCKFIDDMLKDHGEPGVLAGGSYLPKIQQFLRSVGPGPCRCHFYESGIDIEVSRPKVQSNMKMGKCDTPIATLPTFIEYVQMFFKLCGESPISISSGRDSMCLGTSSLRMLLSIV